MHPDAQPPLDTVPASAPLHSSLLKDVSRSFYLTLRVLPDAIRPQIGLAYLLARAADTVADTELVPAARRLAALEALRQRILGQSQEPLRWQELAQHQAASSPAERTLLLRIEDALKLLDASAPDDRKRIRDVLEVITSGQALDLRRFADASAQRLVALAGAEELEDYTWRVAGCVGEFWTRLCQAHVFRKGEVDEPRLIAEGIRFGKGLQLVNILRDVPADLRRGRCYLPANELAPRGLQPKDLLDPASEARLRPIYDAWLEKALGHLSAGWNYTNALPRRCVRVRLACAWPILIGVKTLARLRAGSILDPQQRIKVSRKEVRQVILDSVWGLAWPPAWRRLFDRFARR